MRFNPFDSVPLTTLHFAILLHRKRRTVDQLQVTVCYIKNLKNGAENKKLK